MNDAIVETEDWVTLIGGGEVQTEDLSLALQLAPVLVAADSGADWALAQGISPIAVIGDFDSLSETTRAGLPAARLHQIAEQDSTDFDKALRNIAAPVVLAVGFLGARVDHQLAAFHVLARHSDRACLLLGPREVIFAAPPGVPLQFDLSAGDVVSLFPMTAVSGRSTGLRWPIDGLDFAPMTRIGTSNAAEGPVTLTFDGPGMLVILPRRALHGALTALASRPAGDPDGS
ncbi:MAG: thiamine diphosphokinase [Pseudomonadota bacterium]